MQASDFNDTFFAEKLGSISQAEVSKEDKQQLQKSVPFASNPFQRPNVPVPTLPSSSGNRLAGKSRYVNPNLPFATQQNTTIPTIQDQNEKAIVPQSDIPPIIPSQPIQVVPPTDSSLLIQQQAPHPPTQVVPLQTIQATLPAPALVPQLTPPPIKQVQNLNQPPPPQSQLQIPNNSAPPKVSWVSKLTNLLPSNPLSLISENLHPFGKLEQNEMSNPIEIINQQDQSSNFKQIQQQSTNNLLFDIPSKAGTIVSEQIAEVQQSILFPSKKQEQIRGNIQQEFTIESQIHNSSGSGDDAKQEFSSSEVLTSAMVRDNSNQHIEDKAEQSRKSSLLDDLLKRVQDMERKLADAEKKFELERKQQEVEKRGQLHAEQIASAEGKKRENLESVIQELTSKLKGVESSFESKIKQITLTNEYQSKQIEQLNQQQQKQAETFLLKSNNSNQTQLENSQHQQLLATQSLENSHLVKQNNFLQHQNDQLTKSSHQFQEANNLLKNQLEQVQKQNESLVGQNQQLNQHVLNLTNQLKALQQQFQSSNEQLYHLQQIQLQQDQNLLQKQQQQKQPSLPQEQIYQQTQNINQHFELSENNKNNEKVESNIIPKQQVDNVEAEDFFDSLNGSQGLTALSTKPQELTVQSSDNTLNESHLINSSNTKQQNILPPQFSASSQPSQINQQSSLPQSSRPQSANSQQQQIQASSQKNVPQQRNAGVPVPPPPMSQKPRRVAKGIENMFS